MDIDFRTVVYAILFIFLIGFLLLHRPGEGGGKDHDKKDRDKKDGHR